MAAKFDVPKSFTDDEWKKKEKEIKVSATGIGKTLRDLDGAVKAINAELAGKKDPAKLTPLYKAAETKAKASGTVIKKAWDDAVKKKNKAAGDYLASLHHNMGRYEYSLKSLDANDHRGIDWNVGNWNTWHGAK